MIDVCDAVYFLVAPLAGAWIETSNVPLSPSPDKVAPLAGAWIETGGVTLPCPSRARVAPLAGAWIETGREKKCAEQ